MSTETERRVGNLLVSSQETVPVPVHGSSAVSSQVVQPSSSGGNITTSVSKLEIDTSKEGLSVELKQKQEKMKVLLPKLSRSQHVWMLPFLSNDGCGLLLKHLISVHSLMILHLTLLLICRGVVV